MLRCKPRRGQVQLVEAPWTEKVSKSAGYVKQPVYLNWPQRNTAPNLGFDPRKATKLAMKFHAHSVQYAYELVSTSHCQGQEWGTASCPPDLH